MLASYLLVFFLFNFYFDISASVLGKKYYYFLYTTLEYFSLSILIGFNIQNPKFKYLYLTVSLIFLIFLVLFYLTNTIKRLDSIPIGIESIILMTFIILYFYSQLKHVSNQSIYEIFSFWIVLGILFYIGFTFFFNILVNNLDPVHFQKYYMYSFLGDIFKNMFFALAILFNTNKNKIEIKSIPNLDMI